MLERDDLFSLSVTFSKSSHQKELTHSWPVWRRTVARDISIEFFTFQYLTSLKRWYSLCNMAHIGKRCFLYLIVEGSSYNAVVQFERGGGEEVIRYNWEELNAILIPGLTTMGFPTNPLWWYNINMLIWLIFLVLLSISKLLI